MAAVTTYSTVPVVIDNGSAFIKAGYADDDFPETVFETSVGSSKGAAAGGHAKAKGIIPIERGIITDWDAMEELWKQVFTDGIRVKPEEQQCMLTESPLNPKSNREKTVQIMFEAFDVPAVQLRNDASLSMYASGIMTGLVLSSGEGVTRAVPVVEGNAIPGAVKSFNLGGSQLTERLTSMLGEKGHSLTTPSERVIAQEIKEELCYVAADPDAEKGRADAGEKIEKSYELPDGSILNVGHERYMCPEALFNPVLVGMECGGAHMAVANAIGACDKGVRSKMYQNIVLSGGNTMFTGMKERLKKEVSARAPVGTKVNVVSPASGTHPAWVGASIFASICKDSTQWATKEEYEEVGPEIVHKKCA